MLYWSLEERNRVRQTHTVAKAPIRQRNSMVEPEEGVSGRNIGGLQLGWAGLVLNEDCKIGETVAKGFRDGLPGLVHELFEYSTTHTLWLTPLHLYTKGSTQHGAVSIIPMPGVALDSASSIFRPSLEWLSNLWGVCLVGLRLPKGSEVPSADREG